MNRSRNNLVAWGCWTGVAVVLLGSWLHPLTRSVWDQLDQSFFVTLNGSLAALQDLPGWTFSWAVMNSRLFDAVPFLIMLAFVAWPIEGRFRIRTQDGRLTPEVKRCISFLLLLIHLLLFRVIFHRLVDYFHWNHPGPSLVVPDTIFLSELHPQVHPKDHSSHSFPGDHTAVLVIWAAFCWTRIRSSRRYTAAFLAVFFSLPRLVGGAHWLSDDLVGGGTVAAATFAVIACSPALDQMTQAVTDWIHHRTNSRRLVRPG